MYRRNRVPGGTFFFTVTLADRGSGLLVAEVDRLREAFRVTRRERPFRIEAIVVLPEHLHAVWTLPPGHTDYPGRWRRIKACFSRASSLQGMPLAKSPHGEYLLWQRRYWEHTIGDDADLAHHVDYIHYNPVRHGLVERPRDWPYSSFHRYVRTGLLPVDWAAGALEDRGSHGEPGRRGPRALGRRTAT
jgi:putative transposase